MKFKQLFFQVAVLLWGLQANAGYICTSPNGDTELSVHEIITRAGDTNVNITSENGSFNYVGTMVTEGSLFQKKTVEFIWHDGQLDIFHHPGFCGRGACLPGDGDKITATLTLDGQSSGFSCVKSLD